MITIKVAYDGYEAEQQVEECLYNAIYNKAIDDYSEDIIEEITGDIIEEIEKIKEWYEEKWKETDGVPGVQICIILDDLNKLIDGLKKGIETK